jgi:hypothetical protein
MGSQGSSNGLALVVFYTNSRAVSVATFLGSSTLKEVGSRVRSILTACTLLAYCFELPSLLGITFRYF